MPNIGKSKSALFIWIIAVLAVVLSVVFFVVPWVQKGGWKQQRESFIQQQTESATSRTIPQPAFINKFEQNAEYMKISGGKFIFSVTEKVESIPDLLMAKYPVTNRQYRAFIAYLESSSPENEARLPLNTFRNALNREAKGIAWGSGLGEYLTGDQNLADLFRSKYDSDDSFYGDDQPVVGVSWYAARAYCLWLSLVESKGRQSDLYRLPNEMEWEWSAGGRQGEPPPAKKVRLYPWPESSGEPNSQMANTYDNVGKTTPVGSYTKGATPEGLFDMAGNVKQWMAHRYDINKTDRSCRGSAWDSQAWSEVCTNRQVYEPDDTFSFIGFRVVRTE